MKKKIFSLWLTVLLLSALITSTASAGGNVGFRNATFSLGNSLDVSGLLTGAGGYDAGVKVELTATGIPDVTCVSPGGKDNPPGQNPSQVTATGVQIITEVFRSGTPVQVEAEPTLTGTQGGCSNDNWTARIDFVSWTHATIVVTDLANPGTELLHQEYNCLTTRNPDNVTCTLVQ
jgi:hypothetical protein